MVAKTFKITYYYSYTKSFEDSQQALVEIEVKFSLDDYFIR
jgi:hypothetical protein